MAIEPGSNLKPKGAFQIADSEDIKGAPQNKATLAELNAVPTYLREPGQIGKVHSDPTPANNGEYVAGAGPSFTFTKKVAETTFSQNDVRNTVATGLEETAGAPAATDTLIILLGKYLRLFGTKVTAEAGKRLMTDAEGTKLSNLSQHYKGVHTSVPNLQAAHPAGISGDHADIDPGTGTKAQRYIWDAQEGWVISVTAQAPMAAATDSQVAAGADNATAVTPLSLTNGAFGGLLSSLKSNAKKLVTAYNELWDRVTDRTVTDVANMETLLSLTQTREGKQYRVLYNSTDKALSGVTYELKPLLRCFWSAPGGPETAATNAQWGKRPDHYIQLGASVTNITNNNTTTTTNGVYKWRITPSIDVTSKPSTAKISAGSVENPNGSVTATPAVEVPYPNAAAGKRRWDLHSLEISTALDTGLTTYAHVRTPGAEVADTADAGQPPLPGGHLEISKVEVKSNGATVNSGTALQVDGNPSKAGTGKVLAFFDNLGKLWRGDFVTVDEVARTLTLGSAGNPAMLKILSSISQLSPQPGQPFTIAVNNGLNEALLIQNLETFKKYLAVKTSGATPLQGVVAVENFELDALIGASLKIRQGYLTTLTGAKGYLKAPNSSPEADILIDLSSDGNGIVISGTLMGITVNGSEMVVIKFEASARRTGGAIIVNPSQILYKYETTPANAATCGLEADGATGIKIFVTPSVNSINTEFTWALYDLYMKI